MQTQFVCSMRAVGIHNTEQAAKTKIPWKDIVLENPKKKVRLTGWPKSVPVRTVSSLTSVERGLLMDALQKGEVKFERVEDNTVQSSFVE